MAPGEFCFRENLNNVQMRLRQKLNEPSALEGLLQWDLDELDRTANPALVLAVSRAFPKQAPKAEALAEAVQLLFLANKVHKLMKDDGDLAEELRQYPVLVGDLFYGKFFLTLCREELLCFLDPLAQVMGTMSEGGISRWLFREQTVKPADRLRVIEKESAALMALAARLSAELTGASAALQSKIETFGWELGLAWGVWKEGLDRVEIQGFLKRANAALQELSAEPQMQMRPLREVYRFMAGEISADLIWQGTGA